MAMPTGEHCWKKNSGTPGARTSNLRSFDSKSYTLSTALLRKICEVGFKHCTVDRYSITTMLHVTAARGGGGVTSIIKVYTDVRLEWGILFRPPSI